MFPECSLNDPSHVAQRERVPALREKFQGNLFRHSVVAWSKLAKMITLAERMKKNCETVYVRGSFLEWSVSVCVSIL
jgi:hypothetical protein